MMSQVANAPLSPSGTGDLRKPKKLDLDEQFVKRNTDVDDIFMNRNIFLLSVVNKLTSLSDVSVLSKESIHMDKVVSIPSSFLLKKKTSEDPATGTGTGAKASPTCSTNKKIEEFGCVFFKTREEFAFLMSRMSESGTSSSLAQHDVACQFILPQSLFEEAVRRGFGKPHPFAGLYHPILKVTVPPSLLSIFTPTSKAASEFLINCVQESYLFAKENI